MNANPPCREHDRIELGLRAAMAIKAENAGINYQRLAFLRRNEPWQAPSDSMSYRINRDATGAPVSMNPMYCGWAVDA